MDEFRRTPVNRLDPQGQSTQLPPRPVQPAQPVVPPQLDELPPLDTPEPVSSLTPKPKKRRTALWWVMGIITAIILAAAATVIWYNVQLSPVNASDAQKVAFGVKKGSTTDSIATELKEKGLIRNPLAFVIYAKIGGAQGGLQAGSYRLSRSESVQQIFEHLTKGTVDTFNITFLPGGTIMDNKKVFLKAGYSETEINEAFNAKYDLPLFAGRPADKDLEGYFWGDTYNVYTGASVQDILKTIFAEQYKVIEKNNLVKGFKAHGLSLYEGLTLASIIQRESGNGKDDAQIAQVFYTRLKMGTLLGSDVTYQYIADKEGLPRSVDLDSPYNTRKFPGLPPGPISTPGLQALQAVANPAPGDYLFFLSGDDNVTYFSRTLEEHNRNIVDHCAKKCQII